MKITLTTAENNSATVSVDNKPVGIIKHRDGQMLCYSNDRHTTTQNLEEVIRFFNGDYGSYYYKGHERE